MKLLITSGGTSEKIDQVRSITNHATGQLGSLIAEEFLAYGHEVTLITTPNAIKPKTHKALTILQIENVSQLMENLEPLVKSADAVIHSMAVSDYTPIYMTGLDEVKASESLDSLLEQRNTETKISSASDYQVLFLKKTPKVIQYIKKWNPNTILVGFKLLVDVTTEELINVARKSLHTNHADYILANDLKDINATKHNALLISQDKIEKTNTKNEIAALIRKKVTNDN